MTHANSELINMYQKIHTSSSYGRGGHRFSKYADILIAELNAQSLLDYGCGQTNMQPFLKNKTIAFYRYDPAIPEISSAPVNKVDLVTCTDVLEHIPPQDIEDFLKHVKSYSDHAFFNICTRPASTVLEDGRNAHLSVFTPDQWLEKIKIVFPESRVIPKPYNKSCIVITWDSKNYPRFAREAFLKGIKRSIIKGIRKPFSAMKKKA